MSVSHWSILKKWVLLLHSMENAERLLCSWLSVTHGNDPKTLTKKIRKAREKTQKCVFLKEALRLRWIVHEWVMNNRFKGKKLSIKWILCPFSPVWLRTFLSTISCRSRFAVETYITKLLILFVCNLTILFEIFDSFYLTAAFYRTEARSFPKKRKKQNKRLLTDRIQWIFHFLIIEH